MMMQDHAYSIDSIKGLVPQYQALVNAAARSLRR